MVDVRVRGAIGVIEVERLHSQDKLPELFVNAGIWMRPFHDMFYLTPSLSMTPDQVRQLTTAANDVIGIWSSW